MTDQTNVKTVIAVDGPKSVTSQMFDLFDLSSVDLCAVLLSLVFTVF